MKNIHVCMAVLRFRTWCPISSGGHLLIRKLGLELFIVVMPRPQIHSPSLGHEDCRTVGVEKGSQRPTSPHGCSTGRAARAKCHPWGPSHLLSLKTEKAADGFLMKRKTSSWAHSSLCMPNVHAYTISCDTSAWTTRQIAMMMACKFSSQLSDRIHYHRCSP